MFDFPPKVSLNSYQSLKDIYAYAKVFIYTFQTHNCFDISSISIFDNIHLKHVLIFYSGQGTIKVQMRSHVRAQELLAKLSGIYVGYVYL